MQRLQILYIFVLCAGRFQFPINFASNVVGLRNSTNIFKTFIPRKAIFFAFYNILQSNFAILLISRYSFQLC